jgi:N-methylhydantoinase B
VTKKSRGLVAKRRASQGARRARSHTFDALEVEVFGHLFAALCEEMGAVLQRSAFSANIVERRDFSCALFDSQARLVAQAAHLPVHLGAARASVAAVLAAVRERGARFERGDVWLLNDPFAGGSHLPDLTCVAPVHLTASAEPQFFLVDRAHHADVGGPFPGSMGPARDGWSEGVRIPPVRLVKGGELERGVVDLFLANVRVPSERRGDLFAQLSALACGTTRLVDMAREYGCDALLARAADQIEWTERLARAAVRELAPGSSSASDELELAHGARATIAARVDVVHDERGERLVVDLCQSSDQVPAPLNAPRAVAEAVVFYVLRLLLPEGTPTNHGVLAPLELVTRPGSIVDARAPAAVAAGNVETSQRLVDVVLAALAPRTRRGLPAASNGSMSNLSWGSTADAREAFTHYETHGGGAGGGPSGAGESGMHCHMTNTRNTPIEALERGSPVRVHEFTLARGSGGAGLAPGGDGIAKTVEFGEPVRVSWLSGRRRTCAAGARGGGDGARVRATVQVSRSARTTELEPQDSVLVPRGARVRLVTPGGGGFGARGSRHRGRSGAV